MVDGNISPGSGIWGEPTDWSQLCHLTAEGLRLGRGDRVLLNLRDRDLLVKHPPGTILDVEVLINDLVGHVRWDGVADVDVVPMAALVAYAG